jgi:cell wall-associated NlpC family hydrolase
MKILAKLAAAGLGLLAMTVAALVGAVAALGPLPAASPLPSGAAFTTIPADWLLRYQVAVARCPGLSWTILAGIGALSSDHGRSVPDRGAGRVGPLGFPRAAWASFGVDADHDGATDPSNPDDATSGAAVFLCAHQVTTRTALALHSYRDDVSFVTDVLLLAASYTTDIPSTPGDAALAAVHFALAQLGTPYLWGGDGPTEGGFDCSGLTHAAYAAAGVALPRTAQTQYDAGPLLAPRTDLLPGDLVFFGTSPRHVTHVGLVIDTDGHMVDAPHTGAVVRIDSWRRASLLGATRPTATAGRWLLSVGVMTQRPAAAPR